MDIGIGVPKILRFCIRDLRACTVGIIDGKHL
jgi:hypothetical protein